MTKVLKRFIWIFPIALFLFGCSKTEPTYDIRFGDDVIIKEGEGASDLNDPFGNKGIYTDPEVEIDGIREENYDFPMGSGRHLVYSSETETTYVSIYKGEKGIYFLFECEDDDLSTLNVEDINLVTAQSDSVELYVDTYGMGGQKRDSFQYEFRVTASGRIYSYLTGFVANVFPYGTVNDHTDVDQGFNVEGYISYSVMGEDVNKNTPTSFAFARVTKTGNRGHKWNGEVDPQVPDNYLVLHQDNRFYKLNECPVTGTISGRLVDLNYNPVSGVKVSAQGLKTTYTNSNGEYKLEFENAVDDFVLECTKRDFLDQSLNITKRDVRLAQDNHFDVGDSLFLALNEANYKTTITGTVTERDGKTPIANAKVELNDSFVLSDENGQYTLTANCYGYKNIIQYSEQNHIPYYASLDILEANIDGITERAPIQLDENFGDQVDFGNDIVGHATARVVRGSNSFKLVLKTDAVIDVTQFPDSYFEVFVDTKESNSMNQRNSTDYLFCLAYQANGVRDITNYGGKAVNGNGIITKYGKINELYYVEADIPYEKIGVAMDEVFGLYFGLKQNYNWAGMYDTKGNYIQAEATINYKRLSADSKFFVGSCNEKPDPALLYETIDTIGRFAVDYETVQYTVSYAKAKDYVMLKFKLVDNGIGYFDQSHSINIYLDMNCTPNKTSKDRYSYHISLYPGKPVSNYAGFDEATNKESTKKVYETVASTTWTYLYDDEIYIKISNSIFTAGEAGNPIGFAVGLWNDGISKNSLMTVNHRTVDFNRPNTYFIVNYEQ
ncbi:MAG: hypothetical protein K2N64_08035 [Anaeroplasmataceae bacterium]|nr:hypothetical protein [Anaeroplasmataceae bacterium]